MAKNVEVDLPIRTEKRFLLPSSDNFLREISHLVERRKFSDDEYVQTIYFNNEDHFVPFGDSMKMRRFVPFSNGSLTLDQGTYLLDLKRGHNQHKEKQRLEVAVEDALRIVNNLYSFPNVLRPYVAVVYLRHHYVPPDIPDARITVDTGMEYFFFPPGQIEGIPMGGEEYTRIKMKSLNNTILVGFEKALAEIGAFPIISKKFKAYYFVGLHSAQTHGVPFHKELKDCEIEAKLEAPSEHIFPKIKSLFRNNQNGFTIPPHYPYSNEGATINRYYRDENGIFKAMLKGNDVEIVKKDEGEIVKNSRNLDCILKRWERKGKIIPVNSPILSRSTLEAELYRMRKAFWIENINSKRFYHITVDCCVGEPGLLHEVEVEYTGKYGKPTNGVNEKAIVEDIATITQILINNFSELKPSQLTKQAWLGV